MSDSIITVDTVPAGKVFAGIMSLAIVCGVFAWFIAPPSAGAVIQLGNLSDATFVEIHALDGTVVMSGELRDHVDALGNIEKDAALLGRQYAPVIGEIEIEIPRPDAADQSQELEVDVISLSPRTTYHVVVNDRPVATFTTDDRGSVDLEIEFHPAPASR